VSGSRWNSRATATSWPLEFQRRVEPWPPPLTRWVPSRDRFATVCQRETAELQIIRWGSAAEAAEADLELLAGSCGVGCIGRHFLAWTEGGEIFVRFSVHSAAPITDPGAALLAAGYHRPDYAIPVARWPTPSHLNEPLRRDPMNLSDRARRAREIADRSLDRGDHMHANAMEAALAAEARALVGSTESDLSGLPPWSEASKPGEASYGPFVPREMEHG
jgi:hypothetical protein